MIRLRRAVVAAAAALALAAPLAAAPSQDDLARKRDEKMASPFLKKAPWITDLAKAREASRASGKVIFAYFTRSYAT
jgi:ABC-type sugar transport system substrate-binding protein